MFRKNVLQNISLLQMNNMKLHIGLSIVAMVIPATIILLVL